jgi:hypothetical protein
MDTLPFTRTRKKRTALVLIPGAMNYFYNLCGRRLLETLGELGFATEIGTLAEHSSGSYDWCVLSNISEVVQSYGDNSAALELLGRLRRSCGVMTSTSIDSVATPWYQCIRDYCRAVGVETILDFSLHDQRPLLAPETEAGYCYLPAGLTTAEARSLNDEAGLDDGREIPWAFVGHYTPARAALVDYLVRNIDPRGFVYIPRLVPYVEKGSPHLNQHQFDAVLRRTRYQIWTSHHYAFYMESERFRMSLLAGGVPFKVLSQTFPFPPATPFTYLMVQEAEVAGRLRSFDFVDVRRRFREEFRRVTPLKEGLKSFLETVAVLPQPGRWKAERVQARAA